MNRKYLVCIIAATTITSFCNSQISEPYGELLFQDTISFYPLHDWISIPFPAENVWQIGNSYKSALDSSLSNKQIIITDTLLGYPTMANDYFLLSVGQDDLYQTWAEGILSFNHRFHTDSLYDGGTVEISYDRGISWMNVLNDKSHVYGNFIGLYTETDTIHGGIPAFTGISHEWYYTELHWVWFALTRKFTKDIGWPILRFRFISDSIDSGKDGWMIDHFVFRGYDISGTAKNHIEDRQIVFPNPCKDFIHVRSQWDDKISIFKLYSINGILQLEVKGKSFEIIDVSNIPQGIYYYIILKGSNIFNMGKLVKK